MSKPPFAIYKCRNCGRISRTEVPVRLKAKSAPDIIAMHMHSEYPVAQHKCHDLGMTAGIADLIAVTYQEEQE